MSDRDVSKLDVNDLVRDHGVGLRALVATAEAMGVEEEAVDLEISRLEARLTVLKERARAAGGQGGGPECVSWRGIKEVCREVFEQFAAVVEGRGRAPMIPSQWVGVNQKLGGGWARSNLNVIAARPKIGKTAILETEAYHHARMGRGVAICSAELTPELFVTRMALRLGRLCQHGIGGVYKEGVSARIQSDYAEGLAALTELPIVFVEPVGGRQTWSGYKAGLEATANNWPHDVPLDIVALDHLLRIDLSDVRRNGMSKAESIAEVTRDMSSWIRGTSWAFLLVHQLNRNNVNEKRAPTMEDLKGSGGVEEDMGTLAMPHRKPGDPELEVHCPPGDGERPRKMEKCFLHVVSRFGEGGEVPVWWDPQTMSYLSRDASSGSGNWRPM